MKHKKIAAEIISLIILSLIFGFSVYYVNDYYHSTQQAKECLMSASELENEYYIFGDSSCKKGIIFYPGGKVEYTAYAPLMKALSENGYFCILVKMPFNLAIFDENAADNLTELYPKIKNWYISCHSLGGVVATSYACKNTDKIDGLILLASYSTVDLKQSDLKVLSVYGSQDKVLNLEKYNENYKNLPDDTESYVIEGGCHSYFGDYGNQQGDGIPTISKEEQLRQTVEKINEFTNIE